MKKNKKPLIDRMERKFGKYAIKDLGRYIIFMYGLGSIIRILNEDFYYNWLSLDFSKVLDGQIWRILTFFLQPPVSDMRGVNVLLCVISLAFYYWVFNALEKALGTFRLNLYYFSGVLFNVLITLAFFIIFYIFTGEQFGLSTSLYYVNESLFLAFAVLFPDVTVYFMMMLPVKMKWAAVVWGAFMLYDFIRIENVLLAVSPIYAAFYALILFVSLLNFVIFCVAVRRSRSTGRAHKKMKKRYNNEVVNAMTGARHKCCICGRTELDDDTLEFRFCSKCKGNKEYCNIHLFTHEHVK